MILSISCFPLNRYHSIKSSAAFTHGAFLLVTFPIAVLLPKIAVTLAIATRVPATFQHLCNPPAGTYQSWGYFDSSFFLAHILFTQLLIAH